jgi:hypothetical protein
VTLIELLLTHRCWNKIADGWSSLNNHAIDFGHRRPCHLVSLLHRRTPSWLHLTRPHGVSPDELTLSRLDVHIPQRHWVGVTAIQPEEESDLVGWVDIVRQIDIP